MVEFYGDYCCAGQMIKPNYCNFYMQEIPTIYMDFFKELLIVMDSRANYSNYRDMLKNTVPPAVPYLGMSVIRMELTCIIYLSLQVCF